MKWRTTPDTRFENLDGFPFQPHYVDVGGGMRMHYVDEGPRDGRVVLMMHGEPSWSYLYRHMIPLCAAAGHRVIAPDLIGFGRSDKPTKMSDYSYQRHLDWYTTFLDHLELRDITLFCQDWGGLLGLRLVANDPDRFAGVIAANTTLPTGTTKTPTAFRLWKAFAIFRPWFPISRIVAMGSATKFTKAMRQAYEAPFPSSAYKAGTRAFPRLVPVREDDPEAIANRAAWDVLRQFRKPFLTAFSTGDPIMRGADRYFQKSIPGAQNQPHTRVRGGHFLQEDAGPELADIINRFIASY